MAHNVREMSCTPDLGEMTIAPFAVFSIFVLTDYCSFFCFVLLIFVILPNQGGKRSEAATKGSGVSSIEMMVAASRRTASQVISRTMAGREAARHR